MSNDRDEDSDTTERNGSVDAGPTTVRHDWTQAGRPSVTLVEAVAAATGRRTTDLPPLHGTVDTDALDTLLDGRSSSVTVSFRYAGTGVTVTSNGSVEIRIDDPP
ncbi:HalOD1 output domain-containing protein [Natronomonas marina]|jgi:hypothetical protein|uniref:HalOD1 output domain-containing protein n=1 Tax=Natronomonas marina TaxID=2961939 RepID=UPI0020C9645E|nr:HalOD1 output domain-containing protein [Natronomonas marina]